MNMTTAQFHEVVKIVSGLSPRLPSTSAPRYVTMKGSSRLVIIIQATNAATVTGSAISLLQAKTVAGGSAKALAFTTVWRNLDTEDVTTGDTLTQAAVVANTFTTDTTDAKSLLYLIEVDTSMLDVNNSFDCVRAVTGDGAATVLSVTYYLYPVTGNPVPTAIRD